MLTEGYLNGWLNFEYPNPTSAVREEYILAMVERKYAIEALRLRALSDASIISGAVSKDSIRIAEDNYKRYLALTLPYWNKGAKMNGNGQALSKEDTEHWKNFLKEKKKWAATVLK